MGEVEDMMKKSMRKEIENSITDY